MGVMVFFLPFLIFYLVKVVPSGTVPLYQKGWNPLVLLKATAALGGAGYQLAQNMQLNSDSSYHI